MTSPEWVKNMLREYKQLLEVEGSKCSLLSELQNSQTIFPARVVIIIQLVRVQSYVKIS